MQRLIPKSELHIFHDGHLGLLTQVHILVPIIIQFLGESETIERPLTLPVVTCSECTRRVPGLSHLARLLHRAHHLKRQLLRLGQPLDAGHIKPFIRPIAAQARYLFTTHQPPNSDCAIIAATGEETAVRTGAQ